MLDRNIFAVLCFLFTPSPDDPIQTGGTLSSRHTDLFDRIERLAIKGVALLCLLHTLYQVVKHEFGF